MTRSVRPEPPGGFRELALTARTVPAPRVVPGDRHVDESLKEVLLGGIRRSPGLLQLLVRLEVLPAANEIETVP